MCLVSESICAAKVALEAHFETFICLVFLLILLQLSYLKSVFMSEVGQYLLLCVVELSLKVRNVCIERFLWKTTELQWHWLPWQLIVSYNPLTAIVLYLDAPC